MINKEDWHTCKLCSAKIKDLAKIYGGNGIYYTAVFQKHLKIDHDIELEEYFTDLPLCACNICQQKVDVNRGHKTSNFTYRKYKCGRNQGVLEWSERAKTERLGSGNPMYKKKAWNKNRTKENDDRVKEMSQNRLGIKFSDKTKKKQSISAQNRKIHGHAGHKHSEESKQKMREKTLERIKNGDFKHLKSKPHLIIKEILEEYNISFKEEYRVKYWSFDFYLYELNIYLEVDGDYFHSNPIRWKDGPKSKTQKKNWTRDINKNNFCKNNDMKLIRIWEYDIINNKESVEKLLCELQK
jgi:G:T-mismatch repair DNA endonuclease (very short patch repair protein)